MVLLLQTLQHTFATSNHSYYFCFHILSKAVHVKHAKMYMCKMICHNRIKNKQKLQAKTMSHELRLQLYQELQQALARNFLPPVKSNREYIHQSRRTEHLAATGLIESLKNCNVLCRMYLLKNDSAHARCFAMQSTHQTSVTLRPHWVWSDMLRTQEPDSFNIEILSSFKCFKGTLL